MTSDLGSMVLREGGLLPKSADPSNPSGMDAQDKLILKQHRCWPGFCLLPSFVKDDS
jgi:hypothetical protein